ncbi:nuclear transport factor 2 family protein [Primorskyibacter sp. S187A]|uniref:nuclear transport factor 2 family protein n=1 Tax=Primorskyibacter sp. S187A TaxID=3415130 RepID=UPI003C7CBDB1
MGDAITTFFDAWGMSDAASRNQAIAQALTPDCTYADPRSDGSLSGPDAIASYVAMFSDNAPGWTARVVKSDMTQTLARVTVAFGGPGPSGEEMVQLGQYFARITNEQIAEMTGFVGTGAPE